MRPIEFQDNLSKTQAAERMNQIQKAHGEMEQRLMAAALKDKTASEMERPQAGEKTDMVIIRKDQEKQNKQQQHKKDTRKEDQDQPEQPPEHLDVAG